MRIFKKYIPLQVAKYVKTFFRGRLYISGKGGFMFDSGRLVAEPSSDACHQSVVNEVNGKISELSRRRRDVLILLNDSFRQGFLPVLSCCPV